jgi:hypothetical protein
MKSFATKLLIATFGLTLASAPLAASAAQWSVGIGVAGPGYGIHAGYNDGWRHGYRQPYWRPAPPNRGYYARPVVFEPEYAEGFYGWAPAGFYGYYSHGRWFAHRRWGGGAWFYF